MIFASAFKKLTWRRIQKCRRWYGRVARFTGLTCWECTTTFPKALKPTSFYRKQRSRFGWLIRKIETITSPMGLQKLSQIFRGIVSKVRSMNQGFISFSTTQSTVHSNWCLVWYVMGILTLGIWIWGNSIAFISLMRSSTTATFSLKSE